MRCFLAMAVPALALISAPADDKPKAKPIQQAKMLEWEWLGDTTDANGATFRKFRAVCDGTINPTMATEVARAFCDQITRAEKYQMLSIAQGGTPQMSNWVKNKDGKTFTREYSFRTGGRKGEPAPAAKTDSKGNKPIEMPETAGGKGQLKLVKRGEERAVDAVPIDNETLPGARVSFTLTYTSPPSEEQVKVAGGWLATKEWIYKWAPDGESRYSPWRSMKTIEWKTTSQDKCTVEVQTFVVRRQAP